MKNALLTIVVLISLLITETVLSKSRLTLVKDKDDFSISGYQKPFLLNDKLLFFSIEDSGQTSLWSYDVNSNNTVKLHRGGLWVPDAPRSAKPIINDGLVYFMDGNIYDGFVIWRTDGTLDGTYILDTPRILSGLFESEGVVFAEAWGNGLIAIEGDSFVNHPLPSRSEIFDKNDVCAFSISEAVYLIRKANNDSNHILNFSRSGTAIEIPLPIQSGNSYEIPVNNMWLHNDVCFVSLLGQDSPQEVLMVSEDGSVNKLSEALDLSGMFHIFEHNGRIFGQFSRRMVRFNIALDGFDKEVVLQGAGFISSQSVNNYIASSIQRFVPDPPIPTPTTALFDEELRSYNFGVEDIQIPRFYPTSSAPVYTISENSNGVIGSLISDEITVSKNRQLSIKDAVLEKVISNSERPDVYLLLQDKVTGERSIDKVSETPGIDQSIIGVWHDPEIQNQGISIQVGERSNGSSYIFASIYTFLDGNPLWLAGNADITLPQEKIGFVVRDFNGSNLFDSESTPTEQIFGNLTLEMTGCDSLQAILTPSDNEGLTLNLSRIDNVIYSHLCID